MAWAAPTQPAHLRKLDERAGARECSKDAKLDDWDGYQGAGTFRGYFVILEQNPLAVFVARTSQGEWPLTTLDEAYSAFFHGE